MPATAGKTKPNAGFMKAMRPSEQLAKIVGSEPLPRTEVTKKVWAYIKKHNLQNPENKREIIADDKLQPVFGKKKLNMFEMTKAINNHLKP
jgi:chromatin remodeling complex protein RSC6